MSVDTLSLKFKLYTVLKSQFVFKNKIDIKKLFDIYF